MTALYIPDEPGMLRVGQSLAPLLSPWLETGRGSISAAPKGALVFLYGQLGAGKTTLVRGLLRAYGVQGAVRSPTYTLIEPYQIKPHGIEPKEIEPKEFRAEPASKRIFHLDLYRLADPEELDYLGWQELLGDGGLLLIEWPERGAGLLPPPDFSISIEMQPPGRSLSFCGRGDWQQVATAAARALGTANA